MSKKPGFTLQEHKKLGPELLAMRDRLGEITVLVSRAYPFKLSDPLHKAINIIDKLRSDLDSKVAEENIGNEDALNIYYRAHTSLK